MRDYPEEKGGRAAAMEWQRRVFREQFLLAAKLRRPCTVHCVRQHGVFMAVMKQIRDEKIAEIRAEQKKERQRQNNGDVEERGSNKETQIDEQVTENENGESESLGKLVDAFPPAIAMHSFTGTAHHVTEILKFEQSLFDPDSAQRRGHKKRAGLKAPGAKSIDSTRRPMFYFGFSHIVNVSMCSSAKSRRQGIDAIRSVTLDRLLAESDVHSSVDVEGGTAGSVAYLTAAVESKKGQEGLVEMAKLTARNGLDFLSAGTREKKPD